MNKAEIMEQKLRSWRKSREIIVQKPRSYLASDEWLQDALPRISTLSAQQLVVLRCLAAGMDNRSISVTMSRSERTIKAHVSALIERLQVGSRLQLGLVGYHVVLLANPHLLSDVDGHVPDVLAQGTVRDLAACAMQPAGEERDARKHSPRLRV
jgi:DNA-binding CsgD family transcriptional regulator